MMNYFGTNHLLIGIAILCITLPVLWWKKRNFSYLLFFSIFWFYLLAVVQAVVFPIAINTNYSVGGFTPSINLIPFYFGDCSILFLCVGGVIENILLTLPCGFGINFLITIKPRTSLWLAFAVGLIFESVQLIISLVFRSGFRAVDINDVIFNGIGVLVGYALFRVFAWVYLMMAAYFGLRHKWLFADIYEVAFQAQVIGRSKNA